MLADRLLFCLMTDAGSPGDVRITLIDTIAWPCIEQAVFGRDITDTDPVELEKGWQALVRSGVAVRSGELDRGWETLFASMRSSHQGFRLVSEQDGLIFHADLSLHDGLASCLLRRFGRGPSGKITSAAEQVELAVGPQSQVWTLARRVLPPHEEFRAAPHRCVCPEPITVPEALVPFLAELALEAQADQLPEVPDPILAELLDAKAQSSMLFWRKTATGYEYGLRFWILGTKDFYTVRAGADGPVIERISPGDLGYQLIWYSTSMDGTKLP